MSKGIPRIETDNFISDTVDVTKTVSTQPESQVYKIKRKMNVHMNPNCTS